MSTSAPPLEELFESLLAPIPEAAITAKNPSAAELVSEMQEAVRVRGDDGPPPDWDRARQLAEEILRSRSKHLQAAAAYVEAVSRAQGWTATSAGLKFLENFMDRFWEDGLLPAGGDDEKAYRARPLENLSQKLALILREVPLTKRPDGENISWNDRHKEAKLAQWDGAVARTPTVFYEELQQELDALSAALQSLESIMASDRLFGPLGAPKTSPLREAIRDLKGLIDPIIKEKRKIAEEGRSEAAVVEEAQPGHEDPAWASARRLLGEGKAKDAIREMTRLASQEHGRNRFLRRLELAELLIRDLEKADTKREINKPDQIMFAIVILEDLEEQITKQSLDTWESPQLIGRILGQLAQLCERVPAKESRAADLRQRLRKLDPWQALRWE